MNRQSAPSSPGRGHRPCQLVACVLAAWTAGACLLPPLSAQQAVSEPALKAAFIVNFVKFTTWPDEVLPSGAPIVLCTTEEDIAAALESQVANRTVNDRALVVKRVKATELLRGCSLLYTGRLDQRRAKELLTTLTGTSVLTVGEAEEFATAGGVIGLFVHDGRMKFAVNLKAVERTRVRLSSQVLTLAKIIKG